MRMTAAMADFGLRSFPTTLVPLAILGAVCGPLYSAPAAPDPSAILHQYCYGCHNQKLKSGNLALDALDASHVGQNPAVWEKVVKKLRAGVMPPLGLPRPDKATYDGLASRLESELDRYAEAHPNPGRTEALHRLNRAEYRNAVRDLLGLEIDTDKLLPADDGSYGFDNMAGSLKMSPALMERYLSVAGVVSRLAVGAPVKPPESAIFRVSPALPQYDHVEGLPFGTRGGTLVRYNFPVDGEYEIKIELQRSGTSGGISGLNEAQDMELSLSGDQVKLFSLKPQGGRGGQQTDEKVERKDADAGLRLRLPVQAGPHDVGVAFLLKSHAEPTDMREPFRRTDNAGGNGVNLSQPHVAAVIVTGPFGNAAGLPHEETPSRKKIFVCHPASTADEAGCAQQILTSLARRGYRRPVTDRDLAPLVAEYKTGREGGDTVFDSGIEMAVRRLLVSPEFLFRVEKDPAGIATKSNYRVSDLELASRLSFSFGAVFQMTSYWVWPPKGNSKIRRCSSNRCGAC